MPNLPTIDRFYSMPLAEKIDFLESGMDDLITSLNETDLYIFFKAVILDSNENTYIRRRMLALLTDCVLLKKIRIRHALNLIVDDWNGSGDTFLEVQRLKDLYYFFNEEREQVEKIYINNLKEAEVEIAAESAFHLGLIFMQKSFEGTAKEQITQDLKHAAKYFHQATVLIENRIDAGFFQAVVQILADILDNLWGNVKNSIQTIAQFFYQKEAFSFQFKENPFYLGFYRILNAFFLTTREKPQNWLDVRFGLNHLYVQYAEINNQQLKDRLNHSVVASSFQELVRTEFIEPYYAVNLASQLAKINLRLAELDPSTEEHAFISHIKSLASQDVKKK